MYLVIEKSDSVYAYFESDTHFKKMEKQRANLHKLDAVMLDEECDLILQAQRNGPFRIAIPVREAPVKKQRKKRDESRKRK